MANSSINLTSLDFETLKEQFKTFLRSQKLFNDYDFEGSNISVLLDLMTYNTYMNAFYLNMLGSEMFLDTAQLRDSVVSHSKDLNYTPRSYRSATAKVDLIITPPADSACTAVVIPKGTSFTAKVGSNNFTFTTNEQIPVITNGRYFEATNVDLYEGVFLYDRYVMDYANTTQRFIISNENIDTESLVLNIIEDSSTVIPYTKAESLFDLDYTSRVFFIQACENSRYEIIFGDDVSGRRPKNGAVVVAEYRVSSGPAANGAKTFKPDGQIGGFSNVIVSTVEGANNGAFPETLESIRFNAPRRFTTQERAVTEDDYEILLKSNFPEINTISAFGGDQLDPPQYGKVFIAVDITNADGLPDSRRIVYRDFIKKRSPVSIDPVFISPEFLYVVVNSTVRYNVNRTRLTGNDIKTLVISSITSYNDTNLDDFKSTIRYSQLTRAIDDAQSSIVGNETEVLAMKKLQPKLLSPELITINFNIPLYDRLSSFNSVHNAGDEHTISSTTFVYENQTCSLEDDNNGNVNIITTTGTEHTVLRKVGTIDYSTGIITMRNFSISSYSGSHLKVYAKPASRDIYSSKNVILSISADDISVSTIGVRE